MWYKYLVPRRVNLVGLKGWRWLNVVFYNVSSHALQWKNTGNNSFSSKVPFSESTYEIGPSEHGGWVACGNGMKITYRRNMDEAAATCNRHFLMKTR